MLISAVIEICTRCLRLRWEIPNYVLRCVENGPGQALPRYLGQCPVLRKEACKEFTSVGQKQLLSNPGKLSKLKQDR